jgi:putative hydrolase of the HAD superfamily
MISSPIIKNIVFDLGNVLVDVNYKLFTDAMHWDYEKFMDFVSSDFFKEFEMGKHSEETFFKTLDTYIPINDGDEQRYRDNIPKKFPLRPRTWARLHFLKKRYKILLFSNTNSLDYEALDKMIEIKRVIRYSYVSYVQGYNKPDPKAYQRVEELFHIKPHETLFLDDRSENIEGAKHAGWYAEIIENEDKLFDVFNAYGIR